jgi:hypothetical protein
MIYVLVHNMGQIRHFFNVTKILHLFVKKNIKFAYDTGQREYIFLCFYSSNVFHKFFHNCVLFLWIYTKKDERKKLEKYKKKIWKEIIDQINNRLYGDWKYEKK